MELNQKLVVSKRLKIVYVVISLVGLMFLILQLPANLTYLGISVLILASYGSTVLSLDRDLRHEEWVVFPLYAVLAAIICYSWFSPSIDTAGGALLAAFGFGVIMYGLLLTLNILNIATIRSIPLARPANTVLSMAGLAGSFGLYYLTLSSQPQLLNWIITTGGSTILIAWPLTWVSLGAKLRLQRSILWTLLSALLMMQLALVVSFWPSSFLTSLVMSVFLFLILGIFHLQQKKQLNKDVKKQYLLLGGVVTVVIILFSQW